ncbi:hypothetical protein [Treponema sp.]|uniref:hypothetical protein n=1 Tax=Treponema sp. TaxID=166 RepID=UPI00298EA111|nr:hypothetical protein [Treponema sp.]
MNISEISRQFESYVEDIEEQLSEVLSGNPDLDSTSADEIPGLALSDERLSAECFQDFLHHPKSFSKRVSEKDYSLVMILVQMKIIVLSLRVAESLSPLDDPESVLAKFQTSDRQLYDYLHFLAGAEIARPRTESNDHNN